MTREEAKDILNHYDDYVWQRDNHITMGHIADAIQLLVDDTQIPSDETIMRVLNCIGYEERSWIDTVKENWDKY